MAKSKIMQESREKDTRALRKLSLSEKLQIACELSDLCRELGEAGKKALHVTGRKP